ncbi:putative transcriptional regulator [Leptolyngbyaceae cyanobacterium JSC-12]|nr:putative transcriptional regulator [Leptolyngbyaceae cyanobacterium JSC-12]
MSLSYALLALLIDCPQSGYELNKAFDTSVGCFWKASHQQIYRELGKLEASGWLEAELISQQGKPDKKIYRVTESGKQALTAWIAQPCNITPVKEEILVKLFAGNLVEPEVLRNHVEAHRQGYAERLALYRMIEAKGFPDPQKLSVEDYFRYLTLRCGIQDATSWLAWCEEVLEYLETIEQS